MLRRVIPSTLVALVAALIGVSAPLSAQWLKYPTPNVPRTADGKVNLAAPTPRTPDGKPDFSGMWLTGNPLPCPGSSDAFAICGVELPVGREGFNIGASVRGGLPTQKWAADLVRKRSAENAKDDPHVRCLPDTFIRSYSLPHIMKYVQVPGLLVMLDEMNAMYRQVFTDGRPLPEDPTPAWNGYSSAKWEGDTLVIESNGFRDDLWLDMAGNFISSAAKVRERFKRLDYGHIENEVTVDDPKVYTKPWSVTLKQRIVVDTELIDEICLENEKSSQRMK